MGRVNAHVQHRVIERIEKEGLPVAYIESRVRGLDGQYRAEDVAVRLALLPRSVGAFPDSNGNEVWAIVRGGQVKTVMLRRSDQPATPTALRVNKVIS